MISKKTITIPEKTEERIDFVKCDLCGMINKLTDYKGSDWSYNEHELMEVEIKLKTGCFYPDYGNGDEIRFHICPGCFKNKLMVWFAEQGAIATETEWDY